MIYFAILTAVCVVLLLDRERRDDLFGQRILKLMASTGFIGCALVAGAGGSGYGRWVLAGLALSWIGDACLLSRRAGPFLGGLVSFLLAHLAYGVGFAVLGVDRGRTLFAGGVVAAVALAVGFWLLPKVETRMKGPVVAYLVAISAMVALGAGAARAALLDGLPGPVATILLVAPALFYLSDLAVARDRFISRGLVNRLWGLPLYYAAQILFAVSTHLM